IRRGARRRVPALAPGRGARRDRSGARLALPPARLPDLGAGPCGDQRGGRDRAGGGLVSGAPADRTAVERVEHTGELELRVSGPTMRALLEAALRAVADETEEGDGDDAAAGELERRPLEIDASGPDTLLADLLNEAVFLMETEGFLPTALEARELDGGRL